MFWLLLATVTQITFMVTATKSFSLTALYPYQVSKKSIYKYLSASQQFSYFSQSHLSDVVSLETYVILSNDF